MCFDDSYDGPDFEPTARDDAEDALSAALRAAGADLPAEQQEALRRAVRSVVDAATQDAEAAEEAARTLQERIWREREAAAEGMLRDACADCDDLTGGGAAMINAAAEGLINTRDGIHKERDPEGYAEMRHMYGYH
jgi:hypothetical protein